MLVNSRPLFTSTSARNLWICQKQAIAKLPPAVMNSCTTIFLDPDPFTWSKDGAGSRKAGLRVTHVWQRRKRAERLPSVKLTI